METVKCVASFEDHRGSVLSVSYSSDGKFVASESSHEENTVKIWEVQTSKCVATLKGHTLMVQRVFLETENIWLQAQQIEPSGFG